jgi:hypothetical protein
MGVRAFIVEDDDSVRTLPIGLFNRLWRRDRDASIPDLAGRRVRCVLVFTSVEQRQTTGVRFFEYHFLNFDQTGRLDEATQAEEMRAAVQMVDFHLGSITQSSNPTSVRHAAHVFARRAYDYQYKWKPTQAILQRIGEMLFSRGRTKR